MIKKFFKHIDNIVPLWGIPPLLMCFIINCAAYYITMWLCADLHHYDFTLPFDMEIPVVTEWVFVYSFYCFPFWFVCYCYIARINRDNPKELFRFATADYLSRLICMLFFIFLPTTNVRPDIVGNSIADRLTNGLYSIDQPTNLFPSIHCLVSWFCFVGVRFHKNVKKWVKIVILISACAIMASTQFLKQHYIVDLISGVALAELCYWFTGRIALPEKLMRWYARLVDKLFPGAKLV